MSTSNQINNNEKAIVEKDGNTLILQHRIHQLLVQFLIEDKEAEYFQIENKNAMLSSECQLLNERADSLISQKDEKIRGLEVIVENKLKMIKSGTVTRQQLKKMKRNKERYSFYFLKF